MRRTRIRLGLAIVVAVLAAGATASAGAGGGCHDAVATEARGTAVDVGKNCFGPTVLRVDVGDTVTWQNYDPYDHTITAAGGVFDEKIAPERTFTFRFISAGVYPYYCQFHPRMAGAVVVSDPSIASDATKPVAQLSNAPTKERSSAMQPALLTGFIAVPLSFTAGRILRGRSS